MLPVSIWKANKSISNFTKLIFKSDKSAIPSNKHKTTVQFIILNIKKYWNIWPKIWVFSNVLFCRILLMVAWTCVELLSYGFVLTYFKCTRFILFNCIIFFPPNFGILLLQKHRAAKVILIFCSYAPRYMGNKVQRPILHHNCLENIFLLNSLENQFPWVDVALLLKHSGLN